MYRRIVDPSSSSVQSAQEDRLRDASKDVQPLMHGRSTSMSGRHRDIWLSSVIIALPPLAFSAVLLGLVYRYRITHNPAASENLRGPDLVDEPGVYYVDFSATVLIFIASWSSTLAPLLIGFIMNLASYPISRQFWEDVQTKQTDLPTPYQLSLVVKLIAGGGWGALYDWVAYLVGWRRQRRSQPKPLTTSVAVTVLATALGLVVFLADTWLHVTTSTVDFVQVDTGGSAVSRNHSMVLLPQCTEYLNSTSDFESTSACCINFGGDHTGLMNPAQSYATLNNVSDTVAVLNNGPDPTYTYLGAPTAGASSNEDFTATTFGMRTECKPVSNECNLNAYYGASTPFSCSPNFNGDVQTSASLADGWFASYFDDASMQPPANGSRGRNPYYYGLAAGLHQIAGPLSSQSDPEIITPVHGGIAFVLLCRITMYDIEYDLVNGTITRFVTSPSNLSVAGIWRDPMVIVDMVAKPNLQVTALTAAATAKTAQDLADQYALGYSKAALSVGAQSVRGWPALAVQQRRSLLVTRLPAAPLFTLIAANLAFVALGVGLTVVALRTSGGEVREIQTRLSVVGLVADRFEGSRATGPASDLSQLFEEYGGVASSRVAMGRSALGGYMYWQRWPVS